MTLLFCVFRADCFKLGVTRCAGLLYHKQLVGGNSNIFFFTPTWGNDPIWLIFFKGVGSTTNQTSTLGFSASYLPNLCLLGLVKPPMPPLLSTPSQTFARTKFGEDLPFACISAHPQEPPERPESGKKQIRRIKWHVKLGLGG